MAALAQPVSFGLRAGVPLGAVIAAKAPGYEAGTRLLTIGPAVEFRLPFRFSLGADLLYRTFSYGRSGGAVAEAARWELPVLLRYHFGRARVRPVTGLGASFNRVADVRGDEAARPLAELRHRSTYGIAAAAGVAIRLGALELVPELRATHWVDRNFGVRDTPLQSRLTQIDLLVGVTWPHRGR